MLGDSIIPYHLSQTLTCCVASAFQKSPGFKAAQTNSGLSVRQYSSFLEEKPGICQILTSQAGREQFLTNALTISDPMMTYMSEMASDEENPDSIWSLKPIK
jgi:hypothetical protein